MLILSGPASWAIVAGVGVLACLLARALEGGLALLERRAAAGPATDATDATDTRADELPWECFDVGRDWAA